MIYANVPCVIKGVMMFPFFLVCGIVGLITCAFRLSPTYSCHSSGFSSSRTALLVQPIAHRIAHHTTLHSCDRNATPPPPRLPPATHHHIPATHHHNAPVFSSPLASVTAHPCFFVCGRLVLQLRRTRPRRPDAEPRPRVARGHRLRPPLDTPRMVVPAMRVHRPRDTAEALG